MSPLTIGYQSGRISRGAVISESIGDEGKAALDVLLQCLASEFPGKPTASSNSRTSTIVAGRSRSVTGS